MDTILEVNRVTKIVKGKKLLNEVCLKINKPGVYGIIGRNGSGKSVFFKTIIGLMQPTDGEIYFKCKRMNTGEFAENIGVLLDTPGFIPHYSAFRNLRFLASIRNKISEDEIRRAILSVGLNPSDTTPVRKYSLGMRQRLGIAQAIMENPQFIILDEPMNGLDESGIVDVRKLILSYKKKGVTVLIASHNPEDRSLLCDHVYKMVEGSLQFES